MDKIPRMSRVVRRHLIRLGRQSGEPHTALRFHIVSRLGLGLNSPQVAVELDVARSTVVRTAACFAVEGVEGLYDKRRGNGKAKVDGPFRDALAALLQRTPEHFGWKRPTWTRELLCLQMRRWGWPRVAVCTMGRALARIGARLGMPKPVVLCPWPRDERLRVLAEIRSLEQRATADEPVLYSDEVDIHLNPKIGRDWMLRGQQRRIATPGKNKKFYLAGALDVRTGRLHTTVPTRRTRPCFASCSGCWPAVTAARAASTSCSTTTASTQPTSRATRSSRFADASSFTSCRRTVPTRTELNASGRSSTPTSRETIAAKRSTPCLATRGDISKAIDGGDRPLPLARRQRRDPWTRIALGDLERNSLASNVSECSDPTGS